MVGSGNARYFKVEYLKTHHQQFNAYIFGTSRTAFIQPSAIEKYIPHSKFYNLSVAGNNVTEMDKLLEYLLRNHYTIKHLYIQFGLDHSVDLPDIADSELDSRWHYEVLGGSAMGFYIPYLFQWHKKAIRLRLNERYFANSLGNTEVPTGVSQRNPLINAQREANITAYIQNTVAFRKPRLTPKPTGIDRLRNKEKFSNALKNMDKNCKQYNIHCIFVTDPHHFMVLDWLGEDRDYLIDTISQAIPSGFWYFSYYNSITTDNRNYWEQDHHTENIAPLILARVFSDKSIPVPSDFGVFITKENLKESLEKIKLIEAR